MTLSAEEQAIVATVRDFVDKQVRPVVRDLEHANTYPEELIETMKEIGIFGLAIPEPYGFGAVSMPCYVQVAEELARGWMSLAGAMGGHTVVSKLLLLFGTEEQKQQYLPPMATGELRATMALTEPGGGSDLQAMRTTARRDADSYVVNGSKTWISNARRSGLVALLCKTDPDAEPAHRGVSILLVPNPAAGFGERRTSASTRPGATGSAGFGERSTRPGETGTDGFTISKDLPKLGYKGVEACELNFADCRVPASALLGVAEGRGFAQMMKGLEVGRLQVAARATGVARAAFDDALAYAQDRESFGKPIWEHQAVGNMLADMGTRLAAARALLLSAATRFDSGQRVDMEAGMAKLFCSETAMQIALDAVRVHGGYGYSTEYDVERYFRDAPLMIVGEGTNEIQKGVIAKQLVKRGGLNI